MSTCRVSAAHHFHAPFERFGLPGSMSVRNAARVLSPTELSMGMRPRCARSVNVPNTLTGVNQPTRT